MLQLVKPGGTYIFPESTSASTRDDPGIFLVDTLGLPGGCWVLGDTRLFLPQYPDGVGAAFSYPIEHWIYPRITPGYALYSRDP